MQGGKESLSWGRGSIRSSFVDRATRLARQALADPERARGAIKRVADELGAHPEAPRTWVRTAQVDAGQRPGTTTADAQRIKDLEREVRELRRANEILRKASAYFAQAEPGPPVADLVGFIEDNKGGSGPARSTSCSTVPSALPSTVWGISPGAPPSR